MMLDMYKELTPIVYGENAVKYFRQTEEAGRMCFPMHWHERVELLRIVAGSLELHLGEEKIHVLPGQVVILGPRVLHCGFADSTTGVDYHVITFNPESFCNATRASEKYIAPICNDKTGFHVITQNPKVLSAVDRLIYILCSDDEKNALFVIGSVYEIIGALYKYCETDFKIAYRNDKSFRAVLEYINNCYCEDISSKDISEWFGYNETYFCRQFRKNTGITVLKYIRLLRMDLAQKLLQSTEEEIGNIAWKCGYADVCYFSNCFKRHSGYSPTEFRRKYRNI